MNFHPNKAEILEEFMFKIQNAHVPVEVLNTHIQAFKEHWGGKAAEFMDSIEHEKHRFCAAYTHQHMLLFQTGNSASESGNSSVDAFMNENKPHSLLVQALLQYDAEQNNRERRELQLMTMKLPARLRDVDTSCVAECMAIYSDLITTKFQEELAESTNYSSSFVDEGGFFEVRRNGQLHTARVVREDDNTGLVSCSCWRRTVSGCICRHMLCVLVILGKPLFDSRYIHERWQRRFELPSTEQIVGMLCGTRATKPDGVAVFDAAEITECANGISSGEEFERHDLEFTIPDNIVSKLDVHKSNKKTKRAENFQLLMGAARQLGEFVQNSSELTSIATKSIQMLCSDLRAGRIPNLSNNEDNVGLAPMFATGNHKDFLDGQTIVLGKSFLQLPGPPKRSRFLGSGEIQGSTKRTKSAHPAHKTPLCKVCSGNTCTNKFCRTLAKYGIIIHSDKQLQYAQVLSMEVPVVSLIEHCDFTADPFDLSWEFVVLEHIYRDEKGFKYIRLSALNKHLQLQQPNVLYTFTALAQWLATKPKRKHILLKAGITWESLTNERFARPRNVLRLPVASVNAALRTEV